MSLTTVLGPPCRTEYFVGRGDLVGDLARAVEITPASQREKRVLFHLLTGGPHMGKMEHSRGGTCPSKKPVRKAHQGRTAPLQCLSIQHLNMYKTLHPAAWRDSDAILAAPAGGLCRVLHLGFGE